LRAAEDGWNTFLNIYGDVSMRPNKASDGGQDMSQLVKIVTVAPELPGVTRSIKKLKYAGFVISIGHS
jgi:N-acetylglucosamine-6-phosphate deacetylase